MKSEKFFDKFMKSLTSTWAQDKEIRISDNWQAGVMRDIRLRSATADYMGVEANSGNLIWRFSAVTAVFALLLILYSVRTGFIPYEDLAMLFLDDPVGFIFSTPFVYC